MTTLDLEPDLDEAVAVFLLLGCEGLKGLPPLAPETMQTIGALLRDRRALASAWLAHEAECRALAARKGWGPGFRGRFFAETFATEARR